MRSHFGNTRRDDWDLSRLPSVGKRTFAAANDHETHTACFFTRQATGAPAGTPFGFPAHDLRFPFRSLEIRCSANALLLDIDGRAKLLTCRAAEGRTRIAAQLRLVESSATNRNRIRCVAPHFGTPKEQATAHRSQCFDCNSPIEEDPWWYDPSALARNAAVQVNQPTRAVSQRVHPPTSVSGPFHKACLVRRMGHTLDAPAWS